MKVKIVNGKIEKASINDAETYTLVVNGEENNWAIRGRPSDYPFEIVGNKCFIEAENEHTD